MPGRGRDLPCTTTNALRRPTSTDEDHDNEDKVNPKVQDNEIKEKINPAVTNNESKENVKQLVQENETKENLKLTLTEKESKENIKPSEPANDTEENVKPIISEKESKENIKSSEPVNQSKENIKPENDTKENVKPSEPENGTKENVNPSELETETKENAKPPEPENQSKENVQPPEKEDESKEKIKPIEPENKYKENVKPTVPEKETKDQVSPKVQRILDRVAVIKSPDDLEVQSIAGEIKNCIIEENDLKCVMERLCDLGINDRSLSAVVSAICGLCAHHQAGKVKLRLLLLVRLQAEFKQKDDISKSDRRRFVSSASFLSEVFHYFKSETGAPFAVLADPVLQYLSLLIQPHLQSQSTPNIDEEMIVIAKQLLQNGSVLYELQSKKLSEIVLNVTEVVCRHQVSSETLLCLLAALAHLWPRLSIDIDAKTTHAIIATKLGLSLHI